VAGDEAYRARLLAMADEDKRVRTELTRDGSLFVGYQPRMEAVHVAHALESKKQRRACSSGPPNVSLERCLVVIRGPPSSDIAVWLLRQILQVDAESHSARA
jgi:hypothetical protein